MPTQLQGGAATVWDPVSARNTQAVEQVQRRAARLVTSRYTRDDSPTAMVAELGWLPLTHRRPSARVWLYDTYRIDIPATYLTPLQH